MDKQRIVQLALEAFWNKIVDLTPEGTSGDLPPCVVSRLEDAAEAAVESWYLYNTTASK